ncbi:MAG: DUF1918 domain-containing protein [Pseudonocardiaceae bacterium]
MLSKDGQPPYRMRWTSDDHISVAFPGPGARVVTTEELEVMDREQPSVTLVAMAAGNMRRSRSDR